MLKSNFAEDIFIEFQQRVLINMIDVQHQDFGPIVSLGDRLTRGDSITQNQANYIIKLLEKYKNLSAMANFDYKTELVNLTWKHPFRVLDLSKKIYAEKNAAGKIEICLKFPFQLKKEFEDEINPAKGSAAYGQWDAENKVRRLSFTDVNLIPLYEFVLKRNFEIDESFLEILSEVEEIWQNADEFTPFSIIVGGQVQLVNASEETDRYFEENKTGEFFNDFLLAKSMGYPARDLHSSPRSNLVSSLENSFWIKENQQFFDLYKEVNGKVCIILDRTSNVLEWLQRFVADADASGVSREDIKVCFRENKTESKGLNDWVKLAGVGGKVDTGRIFIFETKPAKWLFKEPKDVKIVVTNCLYPVTNNLTKDLISSHPCVIYLGDIKATEARGQKIVEL
jgi:hypothetical protein